MGVSSYPCRAIAFLFSGLVWAFMGVIFGFVRVLLSFIRPRLLTAPFVLVYGNRIGTRYYWAYYIPDTSINSIFLESLVISHI